MGLGKKAKRDAKAVKGKTKKVRQGQAQGEESQECREALTGLPQLYYRSWGRVGGRQFPEVTRPERAALAAVPGDISSAVAAAATMSSRAAADAVRAVRKLASSSQELVASGTQARPAGRA